MAAITASMVKELREQTGAGMMDCKQALSENDGDIEQAVDWLRKKGLSKAAKKSGRVAADGLVAAAVSDDGKTASVVEVNSETDFVARNEKFQQFVAGTANMALTTGADVNALLAAEFPGSGTPLTDYITNLVATIGENMTLRRAEVLSVGEGSVAAYIHSAVVPGAGKIAVLVALESSADKAKLDELGKQLAMHIAAANPIALDKDGISEEMIERERAVLMDQARDSGKPEEIITKMVEGRLRKYYEEVALLSQVFVIDNETRIEKLLEQKSKEFGAPVKIANFARFELGEGIEKEEQDFASEVAATLGG